MCSFLKNPFLLVSSVLVFSVFVSWVNRKLLFHFSKIDPVSFSRAKNKENVEIENWQSDKDEIIIQNIFISTIKTPIKYWQKIHFLIVTFHFATLISVLSLIYYVLVVC